MSAREPLPSEKARAFLRNVALGAPLLTEPLNLDVQDVEGLLAERDSLFEALAELYRLGRAPAIEEGELEEAQAAARLALQGLIGPLGLPIRGGGA